MIRMIAPWAASIVVHICIMIAAVFLVWSVTTPKEEISPDTVVSFIDPAPVELPSDDANTPDPVESPGAVQPPPRPDTPPVAMPEVDAPAVERTTTPTREMPDTTMRMVEERRFPNVNFGGLGVSNAQNIIYVVDASGSMVSTLRFVKDELKKSVSKLAPTQQFQVVFFQSSPEGRGNPWVAVEHPADVGTSIKKLRFMYASERNVEWTHSWIDDITPRGRSNPIPALEVAIMLRPDAIFILSNTITGAGEWEQGKDEILRRLDALNPIDPRTGRRAITIKTIQFLDDDPTGILEAIGQMHGGENGHNFVSRKELGIE